MAFSCGALKQKAGGVGLLLDLVIGVVAASFDELFFGSRVAVFTSRIDVADA